jgi:hypothetical protein
MDIAANKAVEWLPRTTYSFFVLGSFVIYYLDTARQNSYSYNALPYWYFLAFCAVGLVFAYVSYLIFAVLCFLCVRFLESLFKTN